MLVTLPPRQEMIAAFLASDRSYDGLFLTGVRTTGIFCRPSCPARKPLPENVEFFRSLQEALTAGYRACLRCRPMELPGTVPDWAAALLADSGREPTRRWREGDLRARGLNPDRVRRWFVAQYGMSFHAWQRAQRLGLALGSLRGGARPLDAALDHGFESLSGFADALHKLAGASPGRARAATVVQLARLPSPLGPLLAGATDEGVCLLEFTDRRMLEQQLRTLRRRLGCAFVPAGPAASGPAAYGAAASGARVPGGCAPLASLRDELARYFAGTLRDFTVPLLLPGSDFQREVWAALRTIPPGTTIDYATLARAVGRPTAVRAVARANGDNRVAILVPCHRVIGSDGQLTGYGGGLWRKRWLLDLEACAPGRAPRPTSSPPAAAASAPSARRSTRRAS
jgi:AraC family transcriptional regulator, regulatory protein of adaptative response / methylated-DNA-[protein]-cysteine methyltransferase